MADAMSLGGSALGAFVGGGMAIAGNAINNMQNLNNSLTIMGRQNYYNEKSAENADYRTRKLYEDLYSPMARMQQIKEAGLSPSMLYADGASGTQGQSGAMAPGVTAGVPGSSMDLAGASAQWANVIAQNRLINAQADKTEKEAGVVEDTAKAQIAKAYADAGNAKASAALSAAETDMQNMENWIKGQTLDADIQTHFNEAQTTYYNMCTAYSIMQSAEVKAKVDQATAQNEIKKSSEMLRNIIADTLLKNAGVEVSKAEVQSLVENIAINWQNADANWKNSLTNEESQKSQSKWLERQYELGLRRILTDKEMNQLNNDTQRHNAHVQAVSHVIGSVIMNNAIIGSSLINKIPMGGGHGDGTTKIAQKLLMW